jgi:hypothetical protein
MGSHPCRLLARRRGDAFWSGRGVRGLIEH